MNLVTIEKITKSYGVKKIFDEISFGINTGDKIGVIGINGTGKSSILKIIAGVDTADMGNITYMNGIKIGYLPQTPAFEKGQTVLNCCFNGELPEIKLVKEYENTVYMLEKFPKNEKLSKKITMLAEAMDKLKTWNLQSEAKSILTKLDIYDFDKEVAFLSGGQRKRVAIAGALISPVDLLIMDEPTNHIDSETIKWLEDYLKNSAKALLMVTHDRYFLDRVANRTIELDKGKLYTYIGGYSEFLEKKAERISLAHLMEKKRQNFLRNELEWVRRGALARSTKQKARLQRFEEIKNIKAPDSESEIEIKSASSRLGRKTIEAKAIGKKYSDKILFKDFNYIVLKNDRIGIVGENGAGKTTLIKMLSKNIEPDFGTVEVGETVKIGVFSQEYEIKDTSIKVIDFIRDIAEYVETSDGKLSASQMLETFLFDAEAQYSLVSKLSGGERRRLMLLSVLMSAPNILFLDEPTNDLDTQTLAILENYIDDFNGAVICVSHDRYFLDKCCNRIFAIENRKIKQYEGGYTDYIERKEKESKKNDFTQTSEKQVKTWDKGERKLKMSYKEQKEYETIEQKIEELENKISEIDDLFIKNGTDYVKLNELAKEKEKIEEDLIKTMERWEYLNELAEKIAKS